MSRKVEYNISTQPFSVANNKGTVIRNSGGTVLVRKATGGNGSTVLPADDEGFESGDKGKIVIGKGGRVRKIQGFKAECDETVSVQVNQSFGKNSVTVNRGTINFS